MLPLLDPCNDYVFKRIFARSPRPLTDLVNTLRPRQAPVRSMIVLNPQILPEDWEGKFVALDILAQADCGRLFNLEMQTYREPGWNMRGTYYMARVLVDQLRQGKPYTDLQAVIGVHLLGCPLFPQKPDKALWQFQPRDIQCPEIMLGEAWELNILELSKGRAMLDQALAEGMPVAHWPPLLNWIAYFQKDERAMNDMTYPPVLEALEQLQALSADDEARHIAQMRERAAITERMELGYAAAQGEARGEARGIDIGMQQALDNLIMNGIEESIARKLLGMPDK